MGQDLVPYGAGSTMDGHAVYRDPGEDFASGQSLSDELEAIIREQKKKQAEEARAQMQVIMQRWSQNGVGQQSLLNKGIASQQNQPGFPNQIGDNVYANRYYQGLNDPGHTHGEYGFISRGTWEQIGVDPAHSHQYTVTGAAEFVPHKTIDEIGQELIKFRREAIKAFAGYRSVKGGTQALPPTPAVDKAIDDACQPVVIGQSTKGPWYTLAQSPLSQANPHKIDAHTDRCQDCGMKRRTIIDKCAWECAVRMCMEADAPLQPSGGPVPRGIPSPYWFTSTTASNVEYDDPDATAPAEPEKPRMTLGDMWSVERWGGPVPSTLR